MTRAETQETINTIRGRRSTRDEAFARILNYTWRDQREELRKWMVDEIHDLREMLGCVLHGRQSQVSKSTFESIMSRLDALEIKVNKEWFSKLTADSKGEIRTDVEEVEKAFNIINLSAMPMVRELLVLRELLEVAVDLQTRPRKSDLAK